MSNIGSQETTNDVPEEVRDLHRAIVSLMEELEAIDSYHQRISASKNADLKAIFVHNRDEEKEHAAMLLEWIRRHDPEFSKQLKDTLFADSVAGRPKGT